MQSSVFGHEGPLTSTDVALAFALLLACVLAVLGFRYALKTWRSKKIAKTSLRFARLQEINRSYSGRFCKAPDRLYRRQLASKAQFDRFDPLEFFISAVVPEDRRALESWCADVDKNQREYGRYLDELEQIPRESQYERKSWRRAEKELLRDGQLKADTQSMVNLMYSYTSPKGRNHYRETFCISAQRVRASLEEADARRQRRASRQHTIERERAAMSPGLRYDVLKRDGFRCVLCGSSASDGVKLEVDHIVPVSRGGKTEMDNLQTLCDRCNRGKAAK